MRLRVWQRDWPAARHDEALSVRHPDSPAELHRCGSATWPTAWQCVLFHQAPPQPGRESHVDRVMAVRNGQLPCSLVSSQAKLQPRQASQVLPWVPSSLSGEQEEMPGAGHAVCAVLCQSPVLPW